MGNVVAENGCHTYQLPKTLAEPRRNNGHWLPAPAGAAVITAAEARREGMAGSGGPRVHISSHFFAASLRRPRSCSTRCGQTVSRGGQDLHHLEISKGSCVIEHHALVIDWAASEESDRQIAMVLHHGP